MSKIITTTQLLPVPLEQLIERIIKEDRKMQEQQKKEFEQSINRGDFAQIVARHINQTASNRCLYATQILMNVEGMLQKALDLGDKDRLEQCVAVVCDQLHLYRTQVIETKGISVNN